MSEETKLTHWKKLTNPDYIGSHDFQPNQEFTLTIDRVEKGKVKNNRGKEEDCIICRFKEAKKPMILNKTNMKIITKNTGTPYIEQWGGHKVTLYVTQTEAFREIVDCVRIRLNTNTNGTTN